MGSSPSIEHNQQLNTLQGANKDIQAKPLIHNGKTQQKSQIYSVGTQNSYNIPELQKIIAKSHKDLHSKDPIGKKRYFFQVVNFIFEWLRQAMNRGLTLHEAESIVTKDLIRACKEYPIGKIEIIKCQIKDLKPSKLPDLLEGIENLNKQKFTDRIKQRSVRSKKISYEFNKQMQLLLEKQGGFKFKGGYKNTGVKAYMRILTKILENFLSSSEGSKQVYTNLEHYFWTPIFSYFNKIIDENIEKLRVEVYDWIRCRVFYKTIEQLQQAFNRLKNKFGDDVFRVKNRINNHTRDVLINLKFRGQFAEIQLALFYDYSAYQFNHKLYELTREKLGVAYCCFTILLNEVGEDQAPIDGVMTKSGYVKLAPLREKVEEGFQRLTKQDAEKEWGSVSKLLDEWDVVALKTGTIRGFGFEKGLYDQIYGPQISEMMVIKRRSQDSLTNWLNWMD